MITSEYFVFDNPVILDVSTIRVKLSKYIKLGILDTRKQGKKLLYSLNEADINLDYIWDAIVFSQKPVPWSGGQLYSGQMYI